MKKILLTLFAMLLLAGCGGSSGDDEFSFTDVAGSYRIARFSSTAAGTTAEVVPPDISGLLTLTDAGRYSMDIYVRGVHYLDSGAFSVDKPNITFVAADGDRAIGTMSDGDRTITIALVDAGATVTQVFTRE